MPALDDTKLEAIVSAQIALAKSHDSREREKDRSKALDYYLGKMDKYVPPEPNRSKVVSRDVADTIGWMLPGIMRVYTASDRMAVAEPVGIEDIQFAKEATDGLNHVFWKDNKGYEIVYAATWDALLVGNGVVKTYYDETPIYTTSFHSGLSEDQLTVLLMPDDKGESPEVLAQTEYTEISTDEMGAPIEAQIYDVKIKRKKADGQFVVETIPPEQFLIHEDAITTDESAFTAHWERKTRSELIEMGYDKDTIFGVAAAGRNETPEEQARREAVAPTDSADASVELVDYYECFIRIDVDDDGEAELVRACFAGSDSGKLLDWEVWEDENPFDDIPCEPIPHRWSARSITDETTDVQDVKTVLTRQALNNIYATNNPQRFVTGKIDNMDELLNPTFGGVVTGAIGATVEPLAVPFVANHAFEAMAQQDEVIQRRTGVSRQGQALDPETLQNQTATAAQQQHDASYSQVEQIARNMAEWGWRKVFRKLLRLMIKHQGPRKLMMNGKPIQIDPRFWNADMDVTINVGLGTGSRDRDMQMLNVVKQDQLLLLQTFVQGGAMSKAMEMVPKLVQTMVKSAESAGIRNTEMFYPEMDEQAMQGLVQEVQAKMSQPDPAIELEKAKIELQAQLEREKAAAAVQKEQAQMQADLEVRMAELQATSAAEQQKQQFEAAKFDAEKQFEREKLAEEARQRDLDRRQQMQIEMMKLQAQQAAAERAEQTKRELGVMNDATKRETAKSKATERK